MTVANGQLIPKNRIVGSDRRIERAIPRPAVLSGASGSLKLLGSFGLVSLPEQVHHIEYKFDEGLSGTPTLYIGVRRTGGGMGDEMQDVIDDPVGEMQVILGTEVLAAADANDLIAVDLSSFTDAERELKEGDELVVVIKGTGGAWECPHIALNSIGIQKTPTNTI